MQIAITTFTETHTPVLPIATVDNSDDIIPIVDALQRAEINALEITLRTPAGLDAIKKVRSNHPGLFICAGSVNTEEQLIQSVDAGADLVISPGISRRLIETAQIEKASILPGISTASDILLGMEYGLRYFKFFPAAQLGGLPYLHAMSEPFSGIQFCVTGGINTNNIQHYLASQKVLCVGGSWMTTTDYIAQKNWSAIEQAAIDTVKIIEGK